AKTVRVDTQAPAAPTIVTPSEGSALASSNVGLSGTAEAGAAVTVREGATVRGIVTAGSDGIWALPLTGVADGTHAYTAAAGDAAGNVSPASGARTIRIDTVAPAAPVITAPADSSWNATGTVTVSGTAEANATIVVSEGSSSRGTTNSGSGSWSVT